MLLFILYFDETFVFLSNKLNNFISKYKLFEVLNTKLKSLHKYNILIILIIILGISELIGLLSFIFLAKGSFSIFIILYILKFFPFFVVSYIFKQTKDILMDIDFFKYCYDKIIFITDYLKNLEFIINLKNIKNKLLEKIKSKESVIKQQILFIIKKNNN